MKISKTELAVLVVTLLVFSFTLGYFFRGGSTSQPYIVETDKNASAPAAAEKLQENEIKGDTDKAQVKININTAEIPELKTLPGIGEAIAGRIADYRSEHGNFSKIEEIMGVSGIGQVTFEKMKDLITVE